MIMFPDIDRTTALVRTSWSNDVQPRAEEFASLFYHQFFEREPAVRSMFPPYITAQQRALIVMMDFLVVQDLHSAKVIEQIRLLGRRHSAYGIDAGLFLTFGKVLLQTLADMYGDRWDKDLAVAWSTMYRQVYEVAILDVVQ